MNAEVDPTVITLCVPLSSRVVQMKFNDVKCCLMISGATKEKDENLIKTIKQDDLQI